MVGTTFKASPIDASEASRIEALRGFDLLDSDAEPHLDSIVKGAATQAGTVASTITLIDKDRQWFKARIGIDASETGLDASICNVAMRSADDVFVVPDASLDPRFASMPGVADGLGIRYYAGAPLRTREGASLGMLCVIDTQPRGGCTEDERATLTLLARRTMAAFELRRDLLNARAYAGNRALLREATDLLNRASVALELAGMDAVVANLEHVIIEVEARSKD